MIYTKVLDQYDSRHGSAIFEKSSGSLSCTTVYKVKTIRCFTTQHEADACFERERERLMTRTAHGLHDPEAGI